MNSVSGLFSQDFVRYGKHIDCQSAIHGRVCKHPPPAGGIRKISGERDGSMVGEGFAGQEGVRESHLLGVWYASRRAAQKRGVSELEHK